MLKISTWQRKPGLWRRLKTGAKKRLEIWPSAIAIAWAANRHRQDGWRLKRRRQTAGADQTA